MSKKWDQILRIVCILLLALLAWQSVGFARRTDPLAGVRVPAVPALVKPTVSDRDPKGAGADTNLPPVLQARIERIAQSEILGPVPRPVVVPVTLLGIAGNHIFLRTTDGQTGLLRVGEELNGVKLLQIGTNRAVVEHAGQRKELTMFSGFGSQPLLPKGKDPSQ
jgi:hypothetical protein